LLSLFYKLTKFISFHSQIAVAPYEAVIAKIFLFPDIFALTFGQK